MATGDDKLYAAAGDGIIVWDLSKLSSGKVKKVCEKENAHDSLVQCLAVTDDYSYLVTGALDGYIKLWQLDLKSGSKPKAELENQTKLIPSLTVAGRRIFSADRNGVVRVWE